MQWAFARKFGAWRGHTSIVLAPHAHVCLQTDGLYDETQASAARLNERAERADHLVRGLLHQKPSRSRDHKNSTAESASRARTDMVAGMPTLGNLSPALEMSSPKGLQAGSKRTMPSLPSLEPLKSSQQLGGIAGADAWHNEKTAVENIQSSPAVLRAHAGAAAGTEASAAAMALKLKRATVQANKAPYAQSGNAAEMAAKAAGIASFIVARHPTSGNSKPGRHSSQGAQGQESTSVSSIGSVLNEGKSTAATKSSTAELSVHVRREARPQPNSERSQVLSMPAKARPNDTIKKDLRRAEKQLSSYDFLPEQKVTLADANPSPPRESVKQQMMALEHGEMERRHPHHDNWMSSGLAASGKKVASGGARAQKLVELPADMRGGLHIATAFRRAEQRHGYS